MLVNNAFAVFDADGQPLSTDFSLLQQALDTNLFGAWRTVKAFAPLLRNSDRGRIVNVGSGSGSFTDPEWGLPVHPQNAPAYSISKAALHALTVKLARELKGDRILVNVVCPGFVATQAGLEEYGARPVPDGARGIVWAATLPNEGPTGGFFRDMQPLGW